MLAACGGAERGAGDQGAASAAPYTLVWGLRTSATPESTQAALRDFRATRPHVTVDTFDASGGIDQIMQKLTAGLAGGVPLDVVMGPVTAHMFVESLNVLQPLEELARKDRFELGKYSKEVLNSVGRYNGKVYALPYGYGANLMGVIYNRSLFASRRRPGAVARLGPAVDVGPVPRRAAPAHPDRGRPAGPGRLGQLRQLGDDPAGAVGHPLALAGLQDRHLGHGADDRRLHQVRRPALPRPRARPEPRRGPGGGDPFLTGKAAVTTLGAAPLGYVKRIEGLDWSFTTMPKGRSASADLTAVVLGLAKTSKRPPEAWAFMKFLDDKSRMATLDDRVPTILADAADWTRRELRRLAELATRVRCSTASACRARRSPPSGTPSGRRCPKRC